MRKKLRSSKGMTLTELLVALAIVSLIGTALTVGINSAVKVYRDATQLYESETLCGTILTCLEDEFRFGRNIKQSGTGDAAVVTFDSKTYGKNVKVILKDGKVLIGKDEATGSKLLSDAAYTSGLSVSKCDISYIKPADAARGQIKITINLGPGNKVYVDHTVTVSPVGD